MKNPLLKRLPRELIGDIGKYIVIFLFMTLTIGFVSGFLVADHSMQTAYNESFEKCNIEDGNFTLEQPLTADLPDKIESMDIAVYDNFYKDIESRGKTYRIFINRTDVNKTSVIDGDIAKADNEIALDRLFAENNGIKIGDKVMLEDKEFKVCGTVALADYSALFVKNTDLMFNAQSFTVALVTEEGFNRISDEKLTYCYSWVFDNNSLTEKEKDEQSKDLQELIYKNASLTGFVTEPNNQAIHFSGNDLGGDESMFLAFLYIIIVILAFVFAVTTTNTIEKESVVIGTLRASGYTKGELLCHYIALPIVVTLIGALIGNILGYTVFKNVVADMYYGSYSLPPYQTLWTPYAFVHTTVVPCVIMLVVNFCIIVNKLSLSPLKFLRKDLKKQKNKRAFRLPNFRFMTRFRTRILIQNIPSYIVMFIGILFANILLLFGLMMSPLLDHYKEDVSTKLISDYQYILKVPVETKSETAEKFAVNTLKTCFDDADSNDEISVYGVENNSLYVSVMDFDQNDVYVSEGILEKYGLKIGDTLTLQTKFGDDKYEFVIDEAYDYPASLAVFINIENFRDMFDKDKGYFSGYLSDSEIDDIDDTFIATTVEAEDMTIIADQLTDSMGSMFPLFAAFAVILYMLLVYLLSKIVIEKNAGAVSVIKILGYQDGEISSLYQTSTAIVVIFSVMVSLPLSNLIMQTIFKVVMSSFSGWISLYIDPVIWVEMFVLGIVSYAVIGLLQFRKIKKIPMDEALKNAE